MQSYDGSRSPGAMRSAGSGRGQAGNRARFSADIEYLMRQQKVIKLSLRKLAHVIYTPGPLYNTVGYNTVLDITLIIVGP